MRIHGRFFYPGTEYVLRVGVNGAISEDIEVEPPGAWRDPFGHLGGWDHFRLSFMR